MTDDRTTGMSAAELRRAFDAGFADAPREARAGTLRFLGVRIRGDAFALPIDEMAGLHPAPRIVPLPGALPELLGLAGIRGSLVPIYALDALLGYGAAADVPRWIVLGAGHHAVGLAFAQLEGYFEVERADETSAPEGARHGHVDEVVRVDGVSRGIVRVTSAIAALEARIGVGITITTRGR
jgi:chemotaxis signal transduction protein